MANRNFLSNKLYQLEAYPVLLSCNFVVDSTNGNGLGIRSLKGPGIRNVFMHTSSTPGRGNGNYLNPNPVAGAIWVQLQDNYNKYLAGFSGFVETVSGTALTAVAANTSYVITALGTATLAQWVAKGVPVGVTPAVGVAFTATATGTIGGSAAVQTAKNSGTDVIEIFGDPNTTLSLVNSPVNGGAIFLMHVFSYSAAAFTGDTHTSTLVDNVSTNAGLKIGQEISGTGIPLGTTIAALPSATSITLSAAATATASTVKMTATPARVVQAPVDGSVCSLSFYLSNSSVTVQGQ